jgi:TolA-binding protein
MDFDEKIKEDALFNYALVTYEISYSPFNEGIKAFNEYISLYPASERSDEAYNYLTLAYLNTHNYKDALAYIEKIKIKDNNIRKAYQRIAYFRALELFSNLRYQESIN